MNDIGKYAAFFHDGSIIDINHIGNKMVISMASAEMDEEDLKDDIVLSRNDSIQGKLHIEGIKSMQINDLPFLGRIIKKYDHGKIFDFEITKNFVELSIDWRNFFPKAEVNDFSVIEIEADKIYWENIPDLVSEG